MSFKSLLLLQGLNLCISALAVTDPTCAAGDAACQGENPKVTSTGSYYWPMAMGHPNYYSNPPWPGPTDLQASFSWQFFGPTGTRFEDSFMGPVIDDKKNIFVNGDFHVYKLNENGQLMWTYKMPGQTTGDAPVIYDGKLNGATNDGKIFSVDMETGAENWVTKASETDPIHHCQLAAHQGVVVTKGDSRCFNAPWPDCGHAKLRGLNTTDGKVLWTYDPDEALWDVFPQFPDDSSVIVLDRTGALHRVGLQNGELLWKAGGTPNSWTDGSQFVASNGLTYAVEIDHWSCDKWVRGHVTDCPGFVTAHKTSNGEQVFRAKVPKPPNCSPVVGSLREGAKPVLVMPIGQQSQEGCQPPAGKLWIALEGFPQSVREWVFGIAHTISVKLGEHNTWLWGSQTRTHDVYALDAETGKFIWKWEGPTQHRKMNPGDEDGFLPRIMKGLRTAACPTPWSQPRIGSDGTLYVGNENGDFFAIKDANGDDRIDDSEVSVFHTHATFGHQGSAHAPGMVVAVSFDGVFVFKS